MSNPTIADRLRADIEAAPTHLHADLREAAARIENDLRYIEYIEATNAELRESVKDATRQLEAVSVKLTAAVPPGHVEYISKARAAAALEAVISAARVVLAKAEGKATNG